MQIKDGISPALARLAAGIQNKRPILQAMGLQLESLTKRAFNEPQLRPAPWPAKSDGSAATLRRNQVLVRSIAITSLTNDEVTVGTDRLYAALHQFGGTIRAKGKALRFEIAGRVIFAKEVKVPARPFFPFIGGKMTPSAAQKIERVGLAKIAALTRPPGGAGG